MSKAAGKYWQCMTYVTKELKVTNIHFLSNIHFISQKAQYSGALLGPRQLHLSLDQTMVQPEPGMIHQPHPY
jgi:hypothetical protein